MHDSPRLNLERKSRHADFAAVRAVLRDLDAGRLCVEQQIDTYFHARTGRLKLRVIDARHAELIWYDRPDAGSIRASVYQRVPVDDPGSTESVLASALGVRGQVRKAREVWLWHNVRIHLDEVDGLGTFVEFEAVIDESSDEAISLVRLENLGLALELDPAGDVAGSYADLLGI
jgi:predicted adenylyl cyclase CyaB